MNGQNKENWGSRIGIIFAVMGSAIGIGNFVRFPGIASKYEGGAFMIPYFIALLLLGLPIAWVEWSLGRYGGIKGFNSSPGIFRSVWKNRISPYMGVLGLVVPVGIYMYYVLIESWCLYYAYAYLTGEMNLGKDPGAYQAFFGDFTGVKEDGILFSGVTPAVVFMLISFFLNMAVIYRGLTKGIELLCKYAIPLLFLIAIVMLVRVLTLGTPNPDLPDQNILNGLGYMWNPGAGGKSLLESLKNSQMWLEAAGQIFFSLSVGFGVIITYASYLKKDDDIALSSVTSVSGNEFAEVALGGMILVPAAFIFLGPLLIGGQGTFTLGFITIPMIFAHMPLGQFFGFLWFFLLFLAAYTSSLSMLQPAIAFFEEGIGTGRRASVTLLSFIVLVGTSFVMYFSQDTKALGTMDFWIGSFLIYTLATVEVIIAAWIFGAKNILNEARKGALIKIPRFVEFLIKYVTPTYLIVIFSIWVYQNMPGYIKGFSEDGVARLTLVFIFVLIVFFLFLIGTAVKRWDQEEKKGGVK
ncbi:MAG: sodium-dependent transporter [Spirochaetia bacterium]|nr:sodium-dependent transporter [Spirochaetia bacterium]